MQTTLELHPLILIMTLGESLVPQNLIEELLLRFLKSIQVTLGQSRLLLSQTQEETLLLLLVLLIPLNTMLLQILAPDLLDLLLMQRVLKTLMQLLLPWNVILTLTPPTLLLQQDAKIRETMVPRDHPRGRTEEDIILIDKLCCNLLLSDNRPTILSLILFFWTLHGLLRL
jgi:hypothetical protein